MTGDPIERKLKKLLFEAVSTGAVEKQTSKARAEIGELAARGVKEQGLPATVATDVAIASMLALVDVASKLRFALLTRLMLVIAQNLSEKSYRDAVKEIESLSLADVFKG